MRKDLTDIILVVDRSGSMQSIKDDAEGGINQFVEDQKKEPGQANLTLCEFDHNYRFVHEGVPLEDVGRYELIPGGMTALLDAVGRSINETGERLAKLPEDERPGLVVVLIVTDGQENCSTEFNKQQIQDMIKHQTEKYNWQFTFLAAGADAFNEGAKLGATSNAQFDLHQMSRAYGSTSDKIKRMRSATMQSLAVSNDYTPEELKSMQAG